MYEQNFSSREFRGLFELKVCITHNKNKLHQRVLTECFEKHFEENMVSFGFSKKKFFGTLPPLLNKPMGFITKLLEKQFKVLSKVLPASRCRDYALWFHWCMHIFY